eukprot:325463_1
MNSNNQTQLVSKPNTPPTKVSNPQCDPSSKRAVFVDLACFYKHWRSIPSNSISDCILIIPNIYTEWILRPTKYIQNHQIADNLLHLFSDDVFIKLLQWKYHQGLLFCMLNSIQTVLGWNLKAETMSQSSIAPFWHHLSDALCELGYDPLILDCAFYTDFKSHFGAPSKQIVSELENLEAMSCDAIAEILFESNPTLNVIRSCLDVASILHDQDEKSHKETLKAPVSVCVASTSVDVDALLDNIFDMYTVSRSANADDHEPEPMVVNVSTKVDKNGNDHLSCDVSDEGDDQWWFAEDYATNYDG